MGFNQARPSMSHSILHPPSRFCFFGSGLAARHLDPAVGLKDSNSNAVPSGSCTAGPSSLADPSGERRLRNATCSLEP